MEPPAREKQANAKGVSGIFARAAKEPATSPPNANVTMKREHRRAAGLGARPRKAGKTSLEYVGAGSKPAHLTA